MVGIYHQAYKVHPAAGFPTGLRRPLYYQGHCKPCGHITGKKGHPNQAELLVIEHLETEHGVTVKNHEKEKP